MGNATSVTKENHIFKEELVKITTLINGIVNEKDVYKNNDYNFLSNDSCDKYQILLEKELEKHLKLEVSEIGQKLYVIPKDNDDLDNKHISKKDVCKKVANHYLKILYIISLIKYVYNVEQDGDYSIAGIIFRNIKIMDDLMEIKYCSMPHKDPKNPGLKDTEIDFSGLEGMKFFTDYFLDDVERNKFLNIIKNLLGSKKNNQKLCEYVGNNKELYNKLNCNHYSSRSRRETPKSKKSLLLGISENNAVFSNNMCYSIKKIIVKTNKNQGKQVFNDYLKMKENYVRNISSIDRILNRLIVKNKDEYTLRHLTSNDLNIIIDDTKKIVELFYIQSILDFQIILDRAQKIPNLNLTSDSAR